MRNVRVHRLMIVVFCLGLLLFANSAKAVYRTWDYNASLIPTDGSGTWDYTTATWYTGFGSDTAFTNSQYVGAWFGVGATDSQPYTISLGGGSIAVGGGVTFQNQAYTISNGTLNLSFGTANDPITVNSIGGGTISAVITGSNGLTKNGSGLLFINNQNNAYTGATLVKNGTLMLGAANMLGTSNSVILGASGGVQCTLDLGGYNQTIGSIGTDAAATLYLQTITNSVASTTATLTLNGPSTYGGVIQDGLGQVALRVTAGGHVVLNGSYNDNYTGGTVVSGGMLEATSTTVLPGYSTAGSVSVAAGAILAVSSTGWLAGDIDALRGAGPFAANAYLGIDTSGGDFTYPSNIAGTLGLAKLGSNTLILSGSNTYTGPTQISAGVLSLAHSAALAGTTAISFAGGTLQYTASNNVDYSGRIVNSTSPITIDPNGQSVTFGSGLASSNTAGLTLNSTAPGGLLTLAASNSYGGTTLINSGVLSLAHSAALAGTTAIAFAGGTLQYTASNNVDYSGRIVNSTGPIAIDLKGQGVTFGSGLASSNTAGLTLNSTAPGGVLTLAASNGYSGTTLVSGGTLLLANANAISGSTFDTSGTGSFSFGGLTSANFGGLQGSGNLPLNNTSLTGVALSVGGNNLSTTYSGQLSGNGSLSKVGSGLLYLNGSNNYSGTTAVNAGMLQAVTTAALPAGWSNISVVANATLAVNAGGAGQWAVADIDTLRGAASFAANANLGIDTTGGDFTYPSNITDTGARALGLVKLGSNTLTLSGVNTYTGPTTFSGGTLKLGSANALYAGAVHGNLIAANGTLDLSGNTVTVGSISGNGAIADSAGGASLTFGNASNSTFSGTMQMSNLTKNGAGTFVLAGANNTTGTTTINQGAFQIGNGTATGGVGSGQYSIGSSARLILSQGTSTVTNVPWANIGGNGVLEMADSATTGAILYSPALALPATAGGTLQVDNRGIVRGTPSGLGNMTTVIVNSGAQFFANDGTTGGTAYTYTQSFSIMGLGSSSGYSNGAIRVAGMKATISGNITASGTTGLYAYSSAGSGLKVTGIISGNPQDQLNIYDGIAPPIILANANTFSGVTNVSAGTVQLSNGLALQNSTAYGTIVFDAPGAGTSSFSIGAIGLPAGGGNGKTLTLTSTDGTTPINLTVGGNNASTWWQGKINASSGGFSGNFTKTGTGNLSISNSNTYTGTTTISGGTLTLITWPTGAYTGGRLSVGSTIVDNGTLAFSRTGYSVTNPVPYSNMYGDTFQGADFSAAPITGTGGLVQAGTGGLGLFAVNTYSGPTLVNAGALINNGTLTASTVTVAAGAALAGSGTISGSTIVNVGGTIVGGYSGTTGPIGTAYPGTNFNPLTQSTTGSLTMGSLTFTGSANLFSALGAANLSTSTTSAPIIVNGAVTTAGANTVVINIPASPPPTGTYHYLKFNTLGGAGYSGFRLASSSRTYTLVTNDTGYLDLNYNANNYIVWSGTGSNGYFTGGNNWIVAGVGQTTDLLPGDATVFNDTAGAIGGTPNVNVNVNVSPASVTFNNSLYNYTLSGTGAITDYGVTPTTLVKNGPGGLVTIANTNSYTGGTYINGGTLALGVSNGLPVGKALVLAGSGTFDMAGFNQSVGSLGTGAAAHQVITNSSGASTLTFNGSTVPGTISSYGGTIADSAPGYPLAGGGTLGLTVSSGTLDLTAGNPTYHGPTTINGSVLKVSSLPNTSGILDGGVLVFVGANTNISAPITVNGPVVYSGGSGTLSGLVSPPTFFINISPQLQVTGGALTLSGTASFPYRMSVTGGGTLSVSAGGSLDSQASDTSSYIRFGDGTTTGNFVVSGGTVTTEDGVSFTSTPSSVSRFIMTDGVFQSSIHPSGFTGGIAINGYGSVSGGFLNITTAEAALPSLTLNGGTMDVSGGTITTDADILVGLGTGKGVFNQTGGLITCGGSLNLGFVNANSSGTAGTGGGTMNLSGGTLDLSVGGGTLCNGYGVSSTVNISGSATVIVPTFSMGQQATAYSSSAVINTLNLNGGTLLTNGIVTSGTGTNTVNFNGGQLVANAYSANPYLLSGLTNAFVLAGGARINDGGNIGLTVDQNLQSGTSHDGGLTKSGAGILVLSGSNTYNGGTTVQEGVLQLGNAAALGTGGVATNGGTLDLAGYSITVAGLSGTAGAITDYGFSGLPTTLTVNQITGATYSGQIVDGPNNHLALVVSGSGMLTLTGANAFTGGTTVQSGQLVLAPSAGSAATATGQGDVTVTGGILQGTATIEGNLIVGASGTVSPGTNSPSAAGQPGTLSVTNGATVSAGAHLSFDVGGGGPQSSELNVVQALTLPASGHVTVNLTDVGSFSGSIPLIAFGSLGASGTGSLILGNQPAGASYVLSRSGSEIDLTVTPSTSAAVALSSGSTSWTTALATSTSSQVTLSGSSNSTVSLDGTQSAASLVLSASPGTSITLAEGTGGALTLGTSTAAPTIVVTGGSAAVTAPITLQGNLAVTTTGGATLELSNISQATSGLSLSLNGNGTLTLTGTNDFTGGTTVGGGSMILADAGAIADGTSLTVGSPSAFQAPVVPAIASSPAPAVAAVPEPATLALLAAAAVLLVCRRRRRAV